MSDNISRQAVLNYPIRLDRYDAEHGNRDFVLGIESVMNYVESLPSAEPDTARRIVGKSKDGMTLWYQCEICNEPVDEQDIFCRGCGRRMVNE